MNSILQDIRFAVRQLRRAPFFSVTVILTLALSVGATAAMVGVLRATLLNPLPYPHAERLVRIVDRNLKGVESKGFVSILRTADLAGLKQDGRQVFAGVGFYYSDDSTITLGAETAAGVTAYGVSDEFFSTVGAAPLLGRTVNAADGVRNAPEVVVLSHRLWAAKFGSDPKAIGRVIKLGTVQATVVGVMPEEFNLPAGTDVWHPGHISAASFGGYRGDGSRWADVVARLGESQTLASARQQSDVLAGRLAAAYPESDAAWGFELMPLRDSLFGDYRHALLLLAAAVGLVLLVATVNIASLQLSRNAGRAPEFALRSALGVTRGRLVRQLLTESTLLVLAGSLAGVALAAAILRGVVTLLPEALVRVERPHVDLAVLGVSCAISLVVGLLTGIVPALQSARANGSLAGARTTVGRPKLLGRSFAVMQIGLALVLLTLSAAVLQSLYSLLHTPLGYDASQLQTFTVDLPWGIYGARTHRLYQQLEDSLASTPGVVGVGSISALPLSDVNGRNNFDVAGETPTAHHDAVSAVVRNVSPGYLQAMRIRLLAGRNLSAHDTEPKMPTVVLVNQAFAKRYFKGRNAIGQRLVTVNELAGGLSYSEIVGIVGDVRGTGGAIDGAVQPEVDYAENGGWPHMQFALRTTLPAATVEPMLRRMIPAVDASAALGHFTTLSSTLDRSLAQPRLNAGLLTSFAVLSLVLVVLGVYGLVAFDVSQRVRELGLRIALGSSRSGVLLLVLSEAAKILAIGIVVGLGFSYFASRLLAAVGAVPGAQNVALTVATTALLAVAVLAATLVPASRAAKIDPMEALRSE